MLHVEIFHTEFKVTVNILTRLNVRGQMKKKGRGKSRLNLSLFLYVLYGFAKTTLY